jgi:hypothetical protein
MLDTIILQIPATHFMITNYFNFGTTKINVQNYPLSFGKWVNNPKAQDKKQGIYKPRLTLIKRGNKLFLKMEFSAPKLLFKNNVDELEDKDFDQVIKTIQGKLKDMGVTIWTHSLEKAEVLSFHPSKNIPLSNGFTAIFVIKELKKTDISKRFDLNETEYRNNGEVMQIYTNSHSFVIYDKINDLSKPPKRAIDKNQTLEQLNIFDYVKKNKKHLELLRFEARLSNKQKMNAILENLGYPANPTFKEIFNKDLCKKIINYYWDTFFAGNLFLFAINSNPQEILRLILSKYPDIKITKAINLVGFYVLCKDEEGLRGFRKIIDAYKPKTNWQVVKRDIKQFQDQIFINESWGFINDIKRELKDFKPFKLDLTQMDSG